MAQRVTLVVRETGSTRTGGTFEVWVKSPKAIHRLFSATYRRGANRELAIERVRDALESYSTLLLDAGVLYDIEGNAMRLTQKPQEAQT